MTHPNSEYGHAFIRRDLTYDPGQELRNHMATADQHSSLQPQVHERPHADVFGQQPSSSDLHMGYSHPGDGDAPSSGTEASSDLGNW